MRIEWRAELDLGIEIIDHQHRCIANCYNELAEAGDRGDPQCVGHVLEELFQYIFFHFRFEEEMLGEVGYPFLKAHQRIHQLFVKRLFSYTERYQRGEDIVDELGVFLKRWLFSHIEHEDRDYMELLGSALNGIVRCSNHPRRPDLEPRVPSR